MHQILLFLILFLSLAPSVQAAQPPLDPRLGVVHAAPAYPDRHTTGDVLSYGANRAYDLGFRGLEVWLYYPNVCSKNSTTMPYGFYQNLSWCNSDRTFKEPRLSYLAAQDEYQQVFALPFTTFFLTIDSLNPSALNQFKVSQGVKPATATEKALLYNDLYDFTQYLLTTYANTNKTFILMTGNELEWRVTQKSNCRPECNSTPADPISVALAIDWINTAHRAITQAKLDFPSSGIKIYHATEINHVLTKNAGVKSALTEVLPHIDVDLVGWSAHELKGFFETTQNFDQLTRQGLNKIAQYVADSPVFGSRNVYISEFGLNEMVPARLAHLNDVKTIITSAFNWGVPYFVYWELFDNECETFNPTAEQCTGLWIVKPDNKLGAVYTNILTSFRTSASPSPANNSSDLNRDGAVNLLDYNLLKAGFGTTYNLLHYNALRSQWGR